MNYKNKYIKYKIKYIKLKNQIGSSYNDFLQFSIYKLRINNNTKEIHSFQPNTKFKYFYKDYSLLDNISLEKYIEKNIDIKNYNINVHAITYRFNHNKSDINEEITIFNNITISNYNPNPYLPHLYKNLINHIKTYLLAKKNIYILGCIYTKDKKYKESPYNDITLFISGKIKEGETPKQGAIRESIEECGLDISNALSNPLSNPIEYNYDGIHKDYKRYTVTTYFVNADIENNVKVNKTDIPESRESETYNKVQIIIYGTLEKLKDIVKSITNRTDVNDIQGIALVKLID